MEELEILKWPNPSLSKVAERVTDESCYNIVHNMIRTMETNSGIGLAAPQVGVSKRIITLSNSIYKDSTDNNSMPEVMINPEIIDGIGDITIQESCLSIPGSSFWTQRAHMICVRYEDIDRNKKEEMFTGVSSIVIQHECDHLDGITLADKADQESRRKIISGEAVNAI